MGLSTRALKTDSLDSRSGFNVVARELHTARTLRAFDYLTYTLSRSTARSSDSDRVRVEAKWSVNPIPRSASDPDLRSRVESRIVSKCCLEIYCPETLNKSPEVVVATLSLDFLYKSRLPFCIPSCLLSMYSYVSSLSIDTKKRTCLRITSL